MRLLTGILARQFASQLTGDASLQKRPMKRVVGPSDKWAPTSGRATTISPRSNPRHPPPRNRFQDAMASAQVKSAVLLAGLFAEGETSVTEPRATAITRELALEEFGAPLKKTARVVRISAGSPPETVARNCKHARWMSWRTFLRGLLIAAASLFPDSNLLIHNVV